MLKQGCIYLIKNNHWTWIHNTTGRQYIAE